MELPDIPLSAMALLIGSQVGRPGVLTVLRRGSNRAGSWESAD